MELDGDVVMHDQGEAERQELKRIVVRCAQEGC